MAPGGVDSIPILICSFYAPHVGMPLLERIHFWTQLRASIQEALHSHPRARLVLAGDSNVYLSEVMGCGRERSGESQLRVLIASRDLPIRNLVVHDGSTCACSPNACCPALGSDHRLITFQIALSSTVADDTASPRWPRVRNWLPIVQALRPRLLAWTAKLSELHRDANTFSSEAKLAVQFSMSCMESLFTCFGTRLAPRWLVLPVISPRWDDECYNMMVRRNAAWRSWCREGTAQARDAYSSMRRAFHYLVRKKKALYWHSWLQAQERASAARNIRRQFGPSRRPLSANMRSSSPHGGAVEGAACIEAWRCHFRDVPVSAGSVSASSPDLETDVRRLRRQMYATASRFDFLLSEPELLQVLQQLPANRAPGSDGLTYELYRIDDGTMRNALLSFFEPVRCRAVVPSVWRSAVVMPLHKTGAEDEFANYRPISLLCCGLEVFERSPPACEPAH